MSTNSWPRETTVSSLSDRMDIDIEVRRRGDGYLLIAYRFGVVVRAKDLKSGIEELERRIAIISEDLREVGIPLRSDPIPTARSEMRRFDQLKSSLIVIAAF